MKGARLVPDTEIRAGHGFSRRVRGMSSERDQEGSTVVLLEPDVTRGIKTSEAVNEALRGLLRVASQVPRRRAD